MIKLKQMQADEFKEYKELLLNEYAQDLSENYLYSITDAREKARKEIETDLPQGPLTAGHKLICIKTVNNDFSRPIGYLWYQFQNSGDCIYIYDFLVTVENRSKGYGQLALDTLQKKLKSQNVQQIKLRVAYNNPRALKLYKRLGFNVTGLNMMKSL